LAFIGLPGRRFSRSLDLLFPLKRTVASFIPAQAPRWIPSPEPLGHRFSSANFSLSLLIFFPREASVQQGAPPEFSVQFPASEPAGPFPLVRSPVLDSGSLPHRLGRGSRILSRHERESAGHTFVGRGTPRGCWRRRGCHGDCQCRGGAGGGSDEIPVTFGSPTALTGDGGGVGRRRGAGGEQSCRWLLLTTRLARVWGVGGVYGTVNFVISAAGPHLLLYGAGRRGPTSHLGWAHPIRARL
jgi:hypothetical protein